MDLANIILLTLTIAGTLSFGTIFVILVGHVIKDRKSPQAAKGAN